jgi:hypothetical protein
MNIKTAYRGQTHVLGLFPVFSMIADAIEVG